MSYPHIISVSFSSIWCPLFRLLCTLWFLSLQFLPIISIFVYFGTIFICHSVGRSIGWATDIVWPYACVRHTRKMHWNYIWANASKIMCVFFVVFNSQVISNVLSYGWTWDEGKQKIKLFDRNCLYDTYTRTHTH